MVINIIEPSYYSPKALELYKTLGQIKLGEITQNEKSSVTTLVIRLNHQISVEFLNDFPSLKYIVSPTTGLDHINLEDTQRRGIEIFSLRDCANKISNITSTAEHTLGLMLSLLRGTVRAHNNILLDGDWNRDKYRSRQLSSLTVGIIGMGRIGELVSKFLCAIGSDILYFDTASSLNLQRQYGKSCELETMLSKADIVSIHAKNSSENLNLIGKRELGLMKKTALLINTARSQLVDEHSICDAIRDEKLGGYATDVLRAEETFEVISSSPIVQLAKDGFNVLITPHVGGCTSDAMEQTEDIMAEFFVQKIISPKDS